MNKNSYNFNHDNSVFKLQLRNLKFFVNEEKKTVTARARVAMSVPDVIMRTINEQQLPTGLRGDSFFFDDDILMKSTAKCGPGDVFDANKGKKIATAKLEAKAYRRMAKTVRNWHNQFQNFFYHTMHLCDNFVTKAEMASEHNDKYVNDIA